MRKFMPAVIAVACALSAGAVRAQVGPAMLLVPWGEGEVFQSSNATAVMFDVGVKSAARSLDLSITEHAGRVRLQPERERGLVFGHRLVVIRGDINPAFGDGVAIDQSVGLGMGVGEWRGWKIDVALGVGFSSTDGYSDADGFYGLADLVATRPIDAHSSWTLSLNYHGNRSVFPDVPLPGAAYSRRVNERLSFMVGVPISTVTWKPIDRLRVEARYLLPVSGELMVEYEVTQPVHVFVSLDNRVWPLHVDGGGRATRAFLSQRRVEGGARWSPTGRVEVIGAIGFAFDQELEAGFDLTDTTTTFKYTSEPYVRVGVNVSF